MLLGAAAGTRQSIEDGAWWIGCNLQVKGRKLFIDHNKSNGNTYFFANDSGDTRGLRTVDIILTEALYTPNGAMGFIPGDDAALGDCNVAGCIGVVGINSTYSVLDLVIQ
ncbi:MAG: hypothetical protein M0P01_00610 [Treponema sp.]|nr:hypothetical protein [Treponema sp.]